jgi:carbon-monoxide dehydrogenase small subunit
VNSCLVPAFQVDGRSVKTAESVEPEPLEKMNETGTAQCGACAPGVVMTARWLRGNPGLLKNIPLRQFTAGNLCRCTGYDAVLKDVEKMIEHDGNS